MTNTSWIFVGEHPEDIADGRMVSPGGPSVSLNPDEPHNKAMIERGVLIPNSEAAVAVAEEIQEDTSSNPAPSKGRKNTSEEGSK